MPTTDHIAAARSAASFHLYPTADIGLTATPIERSWRLDGCEPRTEAATLALDDRVGVYLWQTTRAFYRWEHRSDEVVTVLSGECFIAAEGAEAGRERRLGPGDAAYFPAGSRSVWRVPDHLRKISTLVRPLPRSMALALRLARRARAGLTGLVAAVRRAGEDRPLRCELVATREGLLALREEWEALWMRSRGDYPLSFASCLAAWDELHAPAGRRLRCAIIRDARDGGRLVAVLPMALTRKRAWRVAVPLGPEAAEGCDILVAADDGGDAAVALLRFFMATSGADILDLPFVRENNALHGAVLACGAFHAVTQVDAMPLARLSRERDWESYERSLSRQTQTQTARKRRRLEEIGALTIETIPGAADTAIDWLLDEKAGWGRRVGKTGSWLFAQAYRAYLKRLAAEPGAGQRLATFVLRVGGRVAAVKVIAIGPRLATLIIAAYDEALQKFSPGNILDEAWIRHVFDAARDADGRVPDIDFGNGMERYKLHWGRGDADRSRTFKVAATRWGELPYRAKAAARAVRAKVPRRTPVLDTAPAPASSG